MLSDHDAQRIADRVDRTQDPPTLVRWIRALLDDRRARSALVLRLARHVHHSRQRLKQAAAYLDGLLAKAHDDARQPWPDKAVCDRCGAPLDRVQTTPRAPSGHALTNQHPDGTKCFGADPSGQPAAPRGPTRAAPLPPSASQAGGRRAPGGTA